MDINEILNRVTLSLLPEIGAIRSKALVSYYESATTIIELTKSDLANNPALTSSVVSALSNSSFKETAYRKANEELEFITKKGIELVFFDSDKYPKHLKDCKDSPYSLFKKGTQPLVHPKNVAIVGARKATAYGKNFTQAIVRELAQYNCCIVSGLAHGIDAAAHKAALQYNTPTLAVLGHGLDSIYPNDHRNLAIDIVKNGALVSEFFSGTPSLPAHFPKRNRIVAGMVDAVIIVEAAAKGGALVTAKIAESYQKEIYAVPGRSIDPYSKGCNQLIKNQKAVLLDQADELPMELGWEKYDLQKKFNNTILFDGLNAEEISVLKLLQNETTDYTNLLEKSSLGNSSLANALLLLEMKGRISALPGKRYQTKL